MLHESIPPGEVSAEPTKEFFVEMLTRDIKLEQAVLDLVDNCIDGAKRLHPEPESRFDDYTVSIQFDTDVFSIIDNCGGFDIDTARKHAFRFGRADDHKSAPHSIGQFGVGMKRALFKFGRHFKVRSATSEEHWAIDIDVKKWGESVDWTFPWAEFGEEDVISRKNPGTEIIVTELRQEISTRFSTANFKTAIANLIKSKHRQFISSGLSIFVNDIQISATNLYLCMTDKLKPGVDELIFSDDHKEDVRVRITVGIGDSVPKDAGWNVICNGRLVLEADRREDTGWGLLEVEANRLLIPSFHNQYARFRGIVSFDFIYDKLRSE